LNVQARTLLEEISEFPEQVVQHAEGEFLKGSNKLGAIVAFSSFVAQKVVEDIGDIILCLVFEDDDDDDDDGTPMQS